MNYTPKVLCLTFGVQFMYHVPTAEWVGNSFIGYILLLGFKQG